MQILRQKLQTTVTTNPDIQAIITKNEDWASNSQHTQQIFNILERVHPAQLSVLDFPINLSSRGSNSVPKTNPVRERLKNLACPKSQLLVPFDDNHLILSYDQQIMLFATSFWTKKTLERKKAQEQQQPSADQDLKQQQNGVDFDEICFQLLTGDTWDQFIIKHHGTLSPIFNCYGTAGTGKSLLKYLLFLQQVETNEFNCPVYLSMKSPGTLHEFYLKFVPSDNTTRSHNNKKGDVFLSREPFTINLGQPYVHAEDIRDYVDEKGRANQALGQEIIETFKAGAFYEDGAPKAGDDKDGTKKKKSVGKDGTKKKKSDASKAGDGGSNKNNDNKESPSLVVGAKADDNKNQQVAQNIAQNLGRDLLDSDTFGATFRFQSVQERVEYRLSTPSTKVLSGVPAAEFDKRANPVFSRPRPSLHHVTLALLKSSLASKFKAHNQDKLALQSFVNELNDKLTIVEVINCDLFANWDQGKIFSYDGKTVTAPTSTVFQTHPRHQSTTTTTTINNQQNKQQKQRVLRSLVVKALGLNVKTQTKQLHQQMAMLEQQLSVLPYIVPIPRAASALYQNDTPGKSFTLSSLVSRHFDKTVQENIIIMKKRDSTMMMADNYMSRYLQQLSRAQLLEFGQYFSTKSICFGDELVAQRDFDRVGFDLARRYGTFDYCPPSLNINAIAKALQHNINEPHESIFIDTTKLTTKLTDGDEAKSRTDSKSERLLRLQNTVSRRLQSHLKSGERAIDLRFEWDDETQQDVMNCVFKEAIEYVYTQCHNDGKPRQVTIGTGGASGYKFLDDLVATVMKLDSGAVALVLSPVQIKTTEDLTSPKEMDSLTEREGVVMNKVAGILGAELGTTETFLSQSGGDTSINRNKINYIIYDTFTLLHIKQPKAFSGTTKLAMFKIDAIYFPAFASPKH